MKFDTKKLVIALGALTGLVYNSWLLSYLLNPKVAGVALASGLEAKGQPYNWFFISCDVLTGILTLLISALVHKKNKLLIYSLSGLVGFGVLTALTAVLPLDCTGTIRTCGYQGRQAFGLHDLSGAIAAFCLFVAMVLAVVMSKKTNIYVWNIVTVLIWSLLGLSYLLVVIPAISRLTYISTLAVLWQDAFLVVSGLSIVLCCYTYNYLKKS